MARGSIVKRCKACRREGRNQFEACAHAERVYAISYRVGSKPVFKTIGPNKKEAEVMLAKTMSEVNNGTFYQAEEISLNDFIDKWLDEYAAPRIKANTLYKYKNALQKHVRPALGHQYLSKINQNDIRTFMQADAIPVVGIVIAVGDIKPLNSYQPEYRAGNSKCSHYQKIAYRL